MTVSTKGLTTRIVPFFRYYDEETEEEHTIIGSVVNSPLMNNYPVQSIVPVDYSDDDRVVDLASLNSVAAGYFSYRNPDSDKPKVKIDIDLIQLADSSQYEKFRGLETVGLFDTVTVWVAKYNVNVNVKINRVVYNGMKKQVVKVTAGTPTSSLYDDIRNRYKQEVSDLKKYIDGVENGVRNAIRVAAGGKASVFEGYTEPPISAAEPNDIWYQPVGDGEVVMHIFDGLAWVPKAYSASAIGGTIDFGNVNAINFNANWITSGQLDLSRGLSIGSGTDSVLYIDQATGQVVMNVSKLSINAIDAATKEDVDNIALTPGPKGDKGEDSVFLYLDSANGTVFKNTLIATIITATVIVAEHRLDTSEKLKAHFGDHAYLQWQYKHSAYQDFTDLELDDPRISDNGFIFTLTTDDVGAKTIFNCNLIY